MSERFQRYIDAGFLGDLIPILPPDAVMSPDSSVDPTQRGKIPGEYKIGKQCWVGMHDWTERTFSLDDAKKWSRWPGASIGIKTKFIHTVDIDVSNPEDAEAIAALAEMLLGWAPKRGREGSPRIAMPYLLADGEVPCPKIRIAFRQPGDNETQAVELLGDGQQFVVEGIHPSGKPYAWKDSRDLVSVGRAGLTQITADDWRFFSGAVGEYLQSRGYEFTTREGGAAGEDQPIGHPPHVAADKDEAIAALISLPISELGYDSFISVLHAYKASVAGDEEYFKPFVDWAMQHPQAQTEDWLRAKWDSVSGSAIGKDWLFGEARKHGWSGGIEFEALSDLELTADEAIEARRRKMAPIKLTSRYDLMIDQSVSALANSRQQVYTFGSFMVRPGYTERKIWDGSTIKLVRVTHMNVSRLLRLLAKGVPYTKVVKTGRPNVEENVKPKWVDAQGPTEQLCRHILGQGEWPTLPELTGIVTHPIMRVDGSILDAPGYDEATGLLFVSDGTEFPKVKDDPTDNDARVALDTLLKPIRYVPYVLDDDKIREPGICENEPSSSRSVALAAEMSVPLRYAVSICPVFAYSAPRPGETKTTHSDIMSQMIDGKMAPITPVSEDKEEFEKQLKSALKGGDPLIVLNNITVPLGASSLLNSATLDATEGQIKFRDFGKLEDVEVPGYRIFNVNGVRLVVREDMMRRTLLCRIDSGVEKPQSLEYPFNPRHLAHTMRAALIHAALTIARWHHNRGRKAPPGRRFNDYEVWHRLVAGALVALGQPDPLLTQDAIKAMDDSTTLLDRLFTIWLDQLGKGPVGVQEIIDRADNGQADGNTLRDILDQIMLDAGQQKRGGLTKQWLGLWLKEHDGAVSDGRQLKGAQDKHSKAWKWQVRSSEKG